MQPRKEGEKYYEETKEGGRFPSFVLKIQICSHISNDVIPM